MKFLIQFTDNVDYYQLFDINCELAFEMVDDIVDNNRKLWYTDIIVKPYIPEIIDCVKILDFNDNDIIWFKYHSRIIQNLRNWSYVTMHNGGRNFEDASKLHNEQIIPRVKKMIQEFISDIDGLILTIIDKEDT